MKTVGWIYLVAYLIDRALSIVSTLIRPLEGVSNWISFPLTLLLPRHVRAEHDILLPGKVFLVLTAFGLPPKARWPRRRAGHNGAHGVRTRAVSAQGNQLQVAAVTAPSIALPSSTVKKERSLPVSGIVTRVLS